MGDSNNGFFDAVAGDQPPIEASQEAGLDFDGGVERLDQGLPQLAIARANAGRTPFAGTFVVARRQFRPTGPDAWPRGSGSYRCHFQPG
jgi:hypothetical protein